MTSLRQFSRNLFDIRKGEGAKTGFMALYLMLVLFAYYILKPVSRALFLKNVDLDQLPWLYILIAGVGGTLAYFYTKLAIKSSLRTAVNFANLFCTAVLVLFWFLTQLGQIWVLWAFNVWVSLFSVMMVAQGWLVAANVFTAREAKRLYGLLGAGSVVGAAFGGQFTAWAVYEVGTRNLTLASAAIVVLSYLAYRAAIRAAGKSLDTAKGAEKEPEFSFGEITGAIRRFRHLQVIVAIITITFMVDVMVEFQFSAVAKRTFVDQTELTAFLGNFYGFWLNMVTFVLQLFLTSFVVKRFGVGGALQIMPVSIAAASTAALIAPGLLSTAAARLTEASTRYSFNKTGMELLYLPLPLDLRNRTKAFVDVFVDRFARGLGGMVLLALGAINLPHERYAAVVLGFCGVWMVLSVLAQREYVATVRKRLELRRLDIESVRTRVNEPAAVALLERTVRGDNARQAAYALGLLAEAAGYRLEPLLRESAASRHADLRAKAFSLAALQGVAGLVDSAEAELRSARGGAAASGAAKQAARYLVATAADKPRVARQLMAHVHPDIRRATLETLTGEPELAREVIDHHWLGQMAADSDPRNRVLAAVAIRARGDQGTEALHALLRDADDAVAREAIRSAAATQNREYIPDLLERLADPGCRGEAIEALAGYGPRVLGTLGDVLSDPQTGVIIRRQLPRVLRRIATQRAADILLAALDEPDLTVRTSVLRALNKLRDHAPDLNYGARSLTDMVHAEAKAYFELHAAIAPLRQNGDRPATRLLVRTLETRMEITLERVFRLLGLKYPPKQIYAAYVALHRDAGDDHAAAVEFLDNVLERELKRVLLPLLDDDAVLPQRGHELFRIEAKDAGTALRELIASGDAWLSACAMAAAAELEERGALDQIRATARNGAPELAAVARRAEAALR